MYGPGSTSAGEAQRLRQLAFQYPQYRSEYEAMATDIEADRQRAAADNAYWANYTHANNMRQLASTDQDLADRPFQRDLMASEQQRKNYDTTQRYRYLNRQSNNQLSAQREMFRGMQNLFGGGSGGKGGLLDGLLNFGRQDPPTTSMVSADGNKIGGTSYSRNYGGVKGGSLLGALGGGGMRLG